MRRPSVSRQQVRGNLTKCSIPNSQFPSDENRELGIDWSELVPQGELHFARRRGLLELTESQRCGKRKAGIGEIHRVERIEGLSAETDAVPFLREVEGLLKSKIRVEVRCQAHCSPRAAVPRQLIRKRVGCVRVSEDAGVPVLVKRDSGLDRFRQDGQRAQLVVRVVSQIPGDCRRQSRAIPHDAGDLPAPDDSIQPAAGVTKECLVFSDRNFEEIVRADVVADVEIRGAAKLVHVENVLYRGALLAGPRLRG
jgi:hypothetical protein